MISAQISSNKNGMTIALHPGSPGSVVVFMLPDAIPEVVISDGEEVVRMKLEPPKPNQKIEIIRQSALVTDVLYHEVEDAQPTS